MRRQEQVRVQVNYGWALPIFIVLLILKATETIDWSWWWVTLPLWIGPAIVLSFVGFVYVVVLAGALGEGITRAVRRRQR